MVMFSGIAQMHSFSTTLISIRYIQISFNMYSHEYTLRIDMYSRKYVLIFHFHYRQA